MFPNKGTLLIKNFQDLVPKILKLAEENREKYPARNYMKFSDSKFEKYFFVFI